MKIYQCLTVALAIFFSLFLTNDLEAKNKRNIEGIHERGYWIGGEIQHVFDASLAKATTSFLLKENAKRVADFGCGNGRYTKKILNAGISCDGYDGNPNVYQLSQGLATTQDLSIPFDLGLVYDWIVCLEVGEHIPKKYEAILLDNIHRHNSQGVILSWAVKGQGGTGHFNEQNNDYVKARMKELGYINDLKAEQSLRNAAQKRYFKNTVMVFRKS